jgi:glycosyltransferase involved in cell wall biosynthesis
MVASFSDKKKQDTLIDSFQNIHSSINKPLLIFLGDGQHLERFKTSCSDRDIECYIQFHGYVKNVEEWIVASDISVLSSTCKYGEGISNTIIESMACKTPVVASKNIGTKELIDDLNNGVLFDCESVSDLSEKLLMLYKDNDLRESIARNAFEYVVVNHSIDGMIQKFIDIIKESMNSID